MLFYYTLRISPIVLSTRTEGRYMVSLKDMRLGSYILLGHRILIFVFLLLFLLQTPRYSGLYPPTQPAGGGWGFWNGIYPFCRNIYMTLGCWGEYRNNYHYPGRMRSQVRLYVRDLQITNQLPITMYLLYVSPLCGRTGKNS